MNNGDVDRAGTKKSNGLNWPTVALIIASGGGNWLATTQSSQQLRDEQQRAYRRVEEMHAAMDEFEKRQAKSLANQDEILKKLDQFKTSQ